MLEGGQRPVDPEGLPAHNVNSWRGRSNTAILLVLVVYGRQHNACQQDWAVFPTNHAEQFCCTQAVTSIVFL